MEVYRMSSGLLLLLGLSLLATTLQGVQGEVEVEGPSESECRPYIEKALKELETGELADTESSETDDSGEDISTVEITTDDSDHQGGDGDDNDTKESTESVEKVVEQLPEPESRFGFFQKFSILSNFFRRAEDKKEEAEDKESTDDKGDQSIEGPGAQISVDDEKSDETDAKDEANDNDESAEQGNESIEHTENESESKEDESESKGDIPESKEDSGEKIKAEADSREERQIENEEQTESKEDSEEVKGESKEEDKEVSNEETEDSKEEAKESKEEQVETKDDTEDSQEKTKKEQEESKEEGEESEEERAGSKDEEPSTEEPEEQLESDEEPVESKENLVNRKSEEESREKKSESKEEQISIKAKRDVESEEQVESKEESGETNEEWAEESKREEADIKDDDSKEDSTTKDDSVEEQVAQKSEEHQQESVEDQDNNEGVKQDEITDSKEDDQDAGTEHESSEDIKKESKEDVKSERDDKSKEDDDEAKSKEDDSDDEYSKEKTESGELKGDSKENPNESEERDDNDDEKLGEDTYAAPEEELTLDVDIPVELRPRNHVEQLLKLDDGSSEGEEIFNRISEITLKELKKLYENAIKPLEVLYKYRDLSNRHFGDAEIFSKPLILFMGPWSGGKSSIINYLVNNEYNETSLRTGAEPSPAYFNILMYGDEPEIIDGTELAADFTFSGLQKFGQGLEERLKGVKLPAKVLEKVNMVEIPGILEVRKQVSRLFPFNDACQWFIDRADIIFLVYDPSKLDVGPETEAILDQLKGREHQTRIILNKADQVKPEELMRVQGALIWNISPLMSSPQPPVMYTTSLWSKPYEPWAPVRLLQAQERAFLRDLRTAIDKRIENKIASARRFAVRVRNHAKMVDCYLTTYYNHKSVFGNRKQVADEIIEHPQDYHIYEGLSTLTNISRYDLPDPDVYKDFFRLNPLYEFQQLSATCTYFRGCPINRLDVAIAYDLPELVGNHKKLLENALAGATNQSTSAPGS